MSGQHEKSIAEAKRFLELFPEDDFILWTMACTLTQLGRYNEAIQTFKRRKVDANQTNWALAYTYALKGEKEKSYKILAYLEDKSKTEYVPPTFIGIIYIGLGDLDRAMTYIEKGFDDKDNFSIFYKVHPWFAPLKGNARFISLENSVTIKKPI